MTKLEQLCLEEALEDSPQMRSFLNLFEEDAKALKDYSKEFQSVCCQLYSAQNEVTKATQELAHVVRKMSSLHMPLNSDDLFHATFIQFATYLDELNSLQQMLTANLKDRMLVPINNLMANNFEVLTGLANMYYLVSEEREQALMRYMKLPKKCADKLHDEAVEDVYQMRRKFHITALRYYAELNTLQFRRQPIFLEAMLGHLQSYSGFLSSAGQAINRHEVDEFAQGTANTVETWNSMLQEGRSRSDDLIRSIQQQCYSVYFPEPLSKHNVQQQQEPGPESGVPESPLTSLTGFSLAPANPNLASKSGYLFQRHRAGILSKWTPSYFFTQNGNLMTQQRDQVAGGLLLDLSEDGVYAEATDCDDRRHVLQIVSPGQKKTIVLQAENEKERDEWISSITNIVVEQGYRQAQGKSPLQTSQPSTPLKEMPSSASSFFASLFPGSKSNPPATATNSSPIPSGQENMGSGTTQMRQHNRNSGAEEFTSSVFPGSKPILPNSPAAVGSNLMHGPPEQESMGFGTSVLRHQSRSSGGSSAEEVIADWLACQPIQFQLIPDRQHDGDGNGAESDTAGVGSSSGGVRPPHSPAKATAALPCSPHAQLVRTFPMRFMGSVQVPGDRGEHLVTESIRHIIGTRATHNLFKMPEVLGVLSDEGVWLLDPSTRHPIAPRFELENLAYWHTHRENDRLFGFITRSVSLLRDSGAVPTASFTCHVFECNSGLEICDAFRSVTKLAFQTMQERRSNVASKNPETELLLANISQLPDDKASSTPEEQGESVASAGAGETRIGDTTPGPGKGDSAGSRNSAGAGDGDERRVEGAEAIGDT